DYEFAKAFYTPAVPRPRLGILRRLERRCIGRHFFHSRCADRNGTCTRSTSNRKPSRQAEKEECVTHGYLLEIGGAPTGYASLPIRASRCSMKSRTLYSKADSTSTASNVEAPAARRRAIRLFCSATIFFASHTRRWTKARGSSSVTMLPRGVGEVRWRRVWKLDRLTLEVRAAAQGS